MDWFTWFENTKLRIAADMTVNGGRLSPGDALHVLSSLYIESERHIAKQVGESFFSRFFPSNRHGGKWDNKCPFGVVDHYTAGISTAGPLKWFSAMQRSGTSSAHAVIGHDGIIYLVIHPLKHIAWHARGANNTHVGIEHVNAGLLRKNGNQFFYQGTRVYARELHHLPQKIGNKWWEPYRVAQIVSNIVLKRWLVTAIPWMQQEHFVDHQAVDPNRKTDCGPLWPLNEINQLVFSWKPIRDMEWLKKEFLEKESVVEFRQEITQYLA